MKKAVAKDTQYQGSDRFLALAPERGAEKNTAMSPVTLASVLLPLSVAGCVAAFVVGRKTKAVSEDDNADMSVSHDELDCVMQGGQSLGKGEFTEKHALPTSDNAQISTSDI